MRDMTRHDIDLCYNQMDNVGETDNQEPETIILQGNDKRWWSIPSLVCPRFC